MPARPTSLVLLLVSAGALGCRSIALPSILHPGPTESQQEQTQRAMSVSDTDLQTEAPSILPPGYTPRAEVLQSRNVKPNPWFDQNRAYYRQGAAAAPNPYFYSPPPVAPQPNPYAPFVTPAPAAPNSASRGIPSFY